MKTINNNFVTKICPFRNQLKINAESGESSESSESSESGESSDSNDSNDSNDSITAISLIIKNSFVFMSKNTRRSPICSYVLMSKNTRRSPKKETRATGAEQDKQEIL